VIALDENLISEKLERYFLEILHIGKLGLIPSEATLVGISELRKLIGTNRVYSFSLNFRNADFKRRINLILKIYVKALEPVANKYANTEGLYRLRDTMPQLYCGSLERSVKEFQVLKALESVGYPVPRAYICESNSEILGNPFIIMLKEEPFRNGTFSMSSFAKNLARLHSLDAASLRINALKAPENEFDFAKRCLVYFKVLMNLSPRHSREFRKYLELVIRWLDSNVSQIPCRKYCLLHGDYRMKINTILTEGSNMTVIDWEEAEIGDPAYDVGYAYTYIRAEFGEETADQFVQEYLRYSDEDVAKRLFFYKLACHLGWALLHSSVLSNPLMAYEIRGARAFLLFPFLNLPFVANFARSARDVMWVKCFKEFVDENRTIIYH
jgi:aminoglycoside phosphotransferase (APT) family kinase protein